MPTMLGVLTVLLCAAMTCADVVPMADFSLDGMKGKWYSVGIATDATWFTSHKAKMKMGVAQMEPMDSGDLSISLAYLRSNGSCCRHSLVSKKTDTAGCFSYHSKRWESDNVICVTEAKFDEYAIMHITKTKGDQSTVLTKLYSRETHPSKDVEETFKKFSQDSGIQPEHIVLLPPGGECGDE